MGQLIVIEALDAGGSQTQTDKLAQKLRKNKYHTHEFHFPQENKATGRLVYDKFLLPKNNLKFSRREQALLYICDFFSRSEDLWSIKNNSNKHIAVTDRYCSSTMAYQTIGLTGKKRRELLDQIIWLCFKESPSMPPPDLVIFIDTPVDVSLKRLSDKKKDFFENKKKLTDIRNSYLRLAKEGKWNIINGVDVQGNERTRQDIHNEIWEIISPQI